MPSQLAEEVVGNEYKNQTLVHNWWEDRHIPSGLKIPTKDRVLALDLRATTAERLTLGRPAGTLPDGLPSAPGQLAATSKRGQDESMLGSLAPHKPVKPSLFGSRNLDERLATYGKPEALHYTLGGTEVLASDSDRHLNTTNAHFYSKLPELDKSAARSGTELHKTVHHSAGLDHTTARTGISRPPGYFAEAPDRSHFSKSSVIRDTYDKTYRHPSTEMAARGGARGEITRRPLEDGSVYGVSVFVDEYAKWGKVLPERNMSLGESVSRQQTKYF